MAALRNIAVRARVALVAGALSALTLTGVSAHGQTAGPVANFGPAPLDVQAPPQSAPSQAPQQTDAQDVRESRPLLADRAVAPATLDGAPVGRGAEGAGSWTRVAGALAVVLGLIFALRWALRRVSAQGGLRGQLGAGGKAPSGVLEVLGRYPIARGQSLVLLRVDQRVLLLSQSGTGFRTLAMFDEPSDVASLLMKTRDEESESLSGRFRQMLGAFERDPSMTRGVEQIDLTRRAPLIRRSPGASSGTVRRVATPPDAQEAIRRRLATLRESVA